MNFFDVLLGKKLGGGGGGTLVGLLATKNGYYYPADYGGDGFDHAFVDVTIVYKTITAPNLASLTIPAGLPFYGNFKFSFMGSTISFPILLSGGTITGGWIEADGSSGLVASMNCTLGVQGVTLSYGAQIANGTVSDMTAYASYFTDIELTYPAPREQT